MEQIVGGRYQLQERLAEAAVGQTWRAFDSALQRTVTLVQSAVSPPHAAAFGKVSHPAIVALLDFSDTFAVFEYVAGQDVLGLLNNPLEYPPHRLAALLAYVADGLQLVHDQGVAHGSIRAADLIVNGKGVLVLTGFSLAGHGTAHSDLDALAVIVGTCLASAPGAETFTQRSFTTAADLAAAIRALFPPPPLPPAPSTYGSAPPLPPPYAPAPPPQVPAPAPSRSGPTPPPAPPTYGSAPPLPPPPPPYAPAPPVSTDSSHPGPPLPPPPPSVPRSPGGPASPGYSGVASPVSAVPQEGWEQPARMKVWEQPAAWGGAEEQGGWGSAPADLGGFGSAPPDQSWGGAVGEAPAPLGSESPQAVEYGQAGGYPQAGGAPPAVGNPTAFTVAVGYPKRIAKGRASAFMVQIHAPAGLAAAAQRISQIFGETATNLASTQGMLKLGQDVELSLSSPDVEFSSPTHWTVTETGIDSAFWARPGETARAGDHTGLLTIREGQRQLVSLPFTFTIADYALGKISRPAVRWAGTGAGVALSIAVLAYSQINGVQEVAGLVTSAIGAVVSAVVTERTTALYNRRAGRASTTVPAS